MLVFIDIARESLDHRFVIRSMHVVSINRQFWICKVSLKFGDGWGARDGEENIWWCLKNRRRSFLHGWTKGEIDDECELKVEHVHCRQFHTKRPLFLWRFDWCKVGMDPIRSTFGFLCVGLASSLNKPDTFHTYINIGTPLCPNEGLWACHGPYASVLVPFLGLFVFSFFCVVWTIN